MLDDFDPNDTEDQDSEITLEVVIRQWVVFERIASAFDYDDLGLDYLMNVYKHKIKSGRIIMMAYKICRENGVDIPPFIFDALDKWAAGIEVADTAKEALKAMDMEDPQGMPSKEIIYRQFKSDHISRIISFYAKTKSVTHTDAMKILGEESGKTFKQIKGHWDRRLKKLSGTAANESLDMLERLLSSSPKACK